jgi:hypothetical protein
MRYFGGQIWIYKNHIRHIEAGGFENCLHSIKREINLCSRIFGNLAGRGITTGHA